LSGPVDVYSDWIDACETVAKQQADKELSNTGKASADDLEFSTYGASDDRRTGAVGGGGDDDILNDDEY
jgi:transcription elongation factor Elf1